MLALWASLPFEDPQPQVGFTCTLRKWQPRAARGTAFTSVRISISVSLLVRARDEPTECLPWTRRTGVGRTHPLPGCKAARSESRWPRPKELRFLSKLGIPSWLMPLRDRSGQRWQPLGKPYVVAANKACSRFIGTCRTLRCTYIVHTLTRQVFLGRRNEVWLHRFPSPPFGSLFTLSPSHTSFPLSFHVFPCFMSFHLTAFVLWRVQRSGP